MERLLDLGLFPKLAMRRCVLWKDTLRLFSVGAMQSSRCGGPNENLASKTKNEADNHSALGS